MYYDPIKDKIGSFVKNNIFLKKVFYKILGIMFLREWHVKKVLRELITSAGEGYSLFDAGTGFGQYSYYCVKKFPLIKIHASDLKEDYIKDFSEFMKAVSMSQRITFGVEDLTKPIHKEKFNLILSVDVMEHIEEDVKVFENFYKALKPSGRLIVNTPSNLGGSGIKTSHDKSFIGEHARSGYSLEELTDKLKSVGFRVETVKYTYAKFGNIAWKLGIKIPMVLLNTSFLFLLILPLYYIIVIIPTIFLMILDYFADSPTGAGLLVVSVKSSI